MTPSKQIVMSAASVAAAIQAVNGMNAENRKISIPDSDAWRAEAREAVSGAQAQAMIRAVAAPIAATVRIDDKLMRERYAERAGDEADRTAGFLARLEAGASVDIAAAYDMDSTVNTKTLGCYSNCHSACHGSRGWR